MNSKITQNISLALYKKICMGLVAIPYYLILFTWWGNPYHGPGLWSVMVLNMFIVVGVCAAVELMRNCTAKWTKITATLSGLPLLLLLLASLYFAIKGV